MCKFTYRNYYCNLYYIFLYGVRKEFGNFEFKKMFSNVDNIN